MAERSVAELIAAAETMSGSVCAGLARVRKQAAENGVRVTVDVNGRLTGLDLDREAMRLAPHELAALIRRLTGTAASAALAEGITALAGIGGTLVDAALNGPALNGPAQPEEPAEDSYVPQTWRMT